MKTDARVRYTKKIIKENFQILLSKKTLDKITVKKICECAQINRTTFYKYYADPYDLMQQIEDETLEYFFELILSSNSNNIEEIFQLVLGVILENKEFYETFFYKQDTHAFNEKLVLLCYQTIQPVINKSTRLLPIKEQEWFYYYLAQGSSSILDCWVRDNMSDDVKVVAKFIHNMCFKLVKNSL